MKNFLNKNKKLGSHYYDLLIKQYEEYIRSKERIEERRQKSNDFFLTSMTALLALFGFSRVNLLNFNPIVYVVIALSGICYCYLWYRTIKSYRLKARLKYELLHEIETQLPLNLFAAEREILDQRTLKNKYFSTSRLEIYVPWIFMVLFIVILIINLSGFGWIK